jgi:hypothetical protein
MENAGARKPRLILAAKTFHKPAFKMPYPDTIPKCYNLPVLITE